MSLYSYVNESSLYLDFAEATARAGTIRGTTELLADGDMEAVGVGAWIAGATAVLSKTVVGVHGGTQALEITDSGATTPYAAQVVLVIGRRYRVTGWAKSDGTTVAKVYDTSDLWVGTNGGTWEKFDIAFVAGATLLRFYSTNSTGDLCWFDDISCVETDELLNDTDMEATGVAEWLAANAAILTKQGDAYEGTQCLRVENGGVPHNPYAYQILLTVGRKYVISGRARSSGGTAIPRVLDGSGVTWEGSTSTSWQPVSLHFTAGHTWLLFRAQTSVLGEYVEFDKMQVRPVLSRTTDKSKYGRVCLLGDGSTANTIPAFQNPGFDCDGAANYLKVVQASGIFGSAGQTIACAIHPGFTLGAERFFFDSTAGSGRCMSRKAAAQAIDVFMGNTFLGGVHFGRQGA